MQIFFFNSLLNNLKKKFKTTFNMSKQFQVLTNWTIHENILRENFAARNKNLIYLIAVCLGLNGIICITLYQYSAYDHFIQNQTQINLEHTFLCSKKVFMINIDILSTSLSLLMLISYAIIYNRRNFLRNKFKCKSFGLPMILSCWQKVFDQIFFKFTLEF